MAIKLDPIRQESKQGLQDTRSRFATWGRKLLTGTIITSLLVASIPSILTAAGKSKKSKETTVAQLANENSNKNKFKRTETKDSVTLEGNVTHDGCTYFISLEAMKGTSIVRGRLNPVGESRLDGHCFADNSNTLSMPETFNGEFKMMDIKVSNPSVFFVGTYKGNYAFILRESIVGEINENAYITKTPVAEVGTVKVRQDKKGRWIVEGFNGEQKRLLILNPKGEILKDEWDID